MSLATQFENKLIEGSYFLDELYQEKVLSNVSPKIQAILHYAPCVISALGAYLLSPKKTIITGSGIVLINFRNTEIIGNNFTSKLIMGISTIFIGKMLFSSFKTLGLFTLASSTFFAGLYYPSMKSKVINYFLANPKVPSSS